MFCPQCKAEYRDGFSRCSDCDVDLVARFPVKSLHSAPAPSEPEMKLVWFCQDQESCVYVCSRLRAALIPFKVAQRRRQLFWHLDERFEVFVSPSLYDRAKAIAEQGCVDFSDTCEDQKTMELPDASTHFVKHDGPGVNWHPQDATIAVWSEKTEERPWFEQPKGLVWMVELSLRENGIGMRINVSPEGFRRIFVRPEDEFEAREIVRQVECGIPPT
jgi:hypothetical protein